MKITDYYDATNPEHILAYKYLEEQGAWPEEFVASLPDDIEYPDGWHVGVLYKLAKAWVHHMTQGN